MRSDVESYTKTCDLCQKSKPNLHVKKPPLKKTDTPTQIFEKISVDLIGPLSRTNRNNRWVLVDLKDQEKTEKSNQNLENEDFQANVKVRSMKDKD